MTTKWRPPLPSMYLCKNKKDDYWLLELAAITLNGGTRGDPIKFNEVYTQNEVIPTCEMFMDAVNSDVEVPKGLQFEFTLANGEKQTALAQPGFKRKSSDHSCDQADH